MEVNKSDCLLWPGAKDKDGYGFVKIRGKNHKAHRVALEIKLGRKLQANEWSLHLCDTPACFNADHLVVGDVKENNAMRRNNQTTLADRFLPGWSEIHK